MHVFWLIESVKKSRIRKQSLPKGNSFNKGIINFCFCWICENCQAAWIFVCLLKMAQVTLSGLFEVLIIAFTSAHFDQLDMISAYAKLLQKSG